MPLARKITCSARHGAGLRSVNGTRVLRRLQRSNSGATVVAAIMTPSTSFMPRQLAEIQEPAAQQMASAMQRIPITVPSLPEPVHTAFVGPSAKEQARWRDEDKPPVLMLHGFDSSSLEFRRLHPLLAAETEAWAVDLVGWGFSCPSMFNRYPDAVLKPEQKRAHLKAFWADRVQRPMVLVGASLGGAIALDFALHHPEAVSKLVLIDAQGFIDGIGPMASLPRPLAAAGVWVLRTEQLRMAANKMAYHDQAFATEDAMRCGRLHTHLPGWSDANVAFMRSGGYSISSSISKVQQPTLVLWGRQDQILEPEYAGRFKATLPNAELQWLEECGHCGHLEQPAAVADAILRHAGVRGDGGSSREGDGAVEQASAAVTVAA